MDFQKYKVKISTKCMLAANMQCNLWTGTTSKGYGVINVSFGPKEWRQMPVHRAAYFAHKSVYLPKEIEISHLCHNALCVRIDHLSAEPHHVNMNRLLCVNREQCFGHEGYKNCLLELKM